MIKHVLSKENRALLSELVRTDFKLRYQGSVLGYIWSLLRPLLLFLILYIVFVKIFPLGKGVPHYPTYLLMGIVIWSFFTEMTTRSLTSIVEHGDLLRKIQIPRWMIILSSSLSAVINLLLNLVVVAVFMALNHVDVSKTIILLPLILAQVYIFALGISMILSTTYVKYRDVTYIWEVIMQAAFYLTPILYPLSKITNVTFQKLIMINPMAQSIQDARYVTITPKSATIYEVFNGGYYKFIPFIIVIIVFVAGLMYFRAQSKFFAENI